MFLSLLRIKSSKFGRPVNSDIHLQTVLIQMRRLLMSRLISIFTVCFQIVNLFCIPIFKIGNKQGRCPNLAVSPNIPDFTLKRVFLSLCSVFLSLLRVKSGIFGQTAILGQPPCLYHISNIGI